ncbi:Zinc finger (C3HC4-type RING finger) family protein [Striga hermonthica]|uniref:Zinc finger (C3HC4-type RING finger) family protein n=1 Tax=Striga hermonthica TaxID=68872 RepID=A0A9N7MLM4_STRHE|nr:Zinc finger (C3HC4-type RING finger) family protein [Striga hermonthica]
MGSKWRKVKMAFGLNLCVYGHKHLVADNDDDEDSRPPSERRSDAALLSPPGDSTSAPPTPGSTKLRFSKSLSRSSSKKTCSICLASMKRGDGQAIFTAECSHSFHFHCIASNVKHGNQNCPICRAKWIEIPFQGPTGKSRINPLDSAHNDLNTLIRRLPPAAPMNSSRNAVPPLFQAPEPTVFNDDEPVDHLTDPPNERALPYTNPTDSHDQRKVDIKTYTEVSSVPKAISVDSFSVLIHLRASRISRTPRVPVDLVTVLDTSGSMSGTKLALLKRAMGFLIQNLGPNDRLAVVAFSSTARRLFPLRRMSESGRQLSLQAVNSLVAGGGTNIAEGLRKGAKVMEDRRKTNPVSSIILLSDGQDTYTVNGPTGRSPNKPDYRLLLPSSILPVHAFGFGADHDASSMHSISEMSGGTFSFIETEGVIQDAFAQCIGGLLSVVVKDLRVSVECVDPDIRLGTIKSGSYPTLVEPNRRSGSIDVGDLYADEERDFLVSVNLPAENSGELMNVTCVYNEPLANESVTLECECVRVERTVAGRTPEHEVVSIEVDRQKNRVQATEAMARARAAAENGDLAGASSVLESVRAMLLGSASGKARDPLCLALDAELKEMQEKVASRQVYEASGRAYILSGLSSHSWQRATTRGDSVEVSSGSGRLLGGAYQTPLMAEMVTRSQASLSVQRLLRPVWSFGSQAKLSGVQVSEVVGSSVQVSFTPFRPYLFFLTLSFVVPSLQRCRKWCSGVLNGCQLAVSSSSLLANSSTREKPPMG